MSAGLSALALSSLATGCVEEMPEVIEEVQLSNLLTPSSTAYAIDTKDGSTVTFTWTNSKAANYHLEVYAFETEDENTPDDAMSVTDEILASVPENMKFSYDVAPAESGSTSSHTVKFDPELSLYARVCAQSSADPDTKTTGDSKWAVFKYPIETYTVMDPVKSVTVTERTSNSITVSWELEDGDVAGVNQIRVYDFGTDDLQAYTRENVENPTKKENSAVISNLSPSTKYTVAVHYNSANRGQQFVWTTPSWEGVSEAKDTADLKQFLRDAGDATLNTIGEPLRIQLTNTDVPYDLEGVVDILGPVEILGAQTTEGKSPVILGGFNAQPALTGYSYWDTKGEQQTIASTIGATFVRFEALELDGDAYGADRPYKLAADFPADKPLTFEMINCDVHAYKSGFFYDNTKVASWDKILIDNNIITDIQGAGGDGFDVRKAGTINSIEITNNTIDAGFRDFIRVDVEAGGTSINSFLMDHNTINNLAGSEASETRRVFYVRAATQTFTVSDNLFLNIEKQIFTHSGTDGVDPKTMTRNFFYNCQNEKFFETLPDGAEERTDEFTQDIATAGGGAVVSSDPCYNSGRSIFNVTNAAILEAGAGDPRWLVDYIVPVEPELTAVNESDEYKSKGAYTWNLTDLDTFYESIESKCRLGNIQFYIDGTPVTVDEEGFHFTGEATTEYSGVPVDGALAFLVSERGSVVISTQASGSTNDHITVAYGPADGSSAKVQGSISTGADRNRVVFPDLTPGEKTMIYIYACGPITMTALSWISAVETINPQVLATPENVQLTAASGDETSSAVKLTWNAVDAAGGYEVTVTGPRAADVNTYNISGTEYEFNPADLTVGTYSFTVKATVAEGDMTHDPSEPSEALSYLRNETWGTVSSSAISSWGSTDLQYMNEITGGEKISTVDYIYNGMKYLAGNNSISFVSAKNAKDEDAYAFSSGGSGSTEKRALQFKVPGPGTLTFEAISGDTERYVKVYIGENEYTAGNGYDSTNGGYPAPDKSKPEEITAKAVHTLDLTGESISEGTVISLFSKSSGINFFSVTWTPAGYDPDATWPIDETAINEEYIKDFKEDAAEFPDKLFTGQASTVGKFTIMPRTSDEKTKFEDGKLKFGGASKYDEETMIPTDRYLSFKITQPGTIYHKTAASGGGDDSPTRHFVIALLLPGQEKATVLYDEVKTQSGDDDFLTVQVTASHLAGITSAATVYFYCYENAINIEGAGFVPAQ